MSSKMQPIEYFSDGIRKVDYVLVVTRIAARKHVNVVTELVNNLRELGLEIEQNLGVTESVVFLKIHIPNETIMLMSQMNQSWEKTKQINGTKPRRNWWNSIFKTPLAYVNPNKGRDYCGRIYYIAQILRKAKWGTKRKDHGIDLLIRKHIIQKAYPLHDGPVQDLNLDDEYLNDRSLLAKYWANFRCFYKEQPLDIIKKYYGIPTAFYFAWMGFYVQMLIPVAIMSALTLLMCLKRWYLQADDYIRECKQLDFEICRYCKPEDNRCVTSNIKSHCFFMSLSLAFDEKENMLYSILVSFWAGTVQSMWMRREHNLRKRWNLLDTDSYYLHPRFEFWEKVRYRRISSITNEIEAYIPVSINVFRFVIVFLVTVLIVIMMLFILFINVNIIVIIKHLCRSRYGISNLYFMDIVLWFQQLIVYFCFRGNILKFVVVMANYLCYKYESQYDVHLLHQYFLFDAVSSSGVYMYYALVKGLFYNLPPRYENTHIHNWAGMLVYERCQPYTCHISLMMLVGFRQAIFCIISIIEYLITVFKDTKIKFVTSQHEYEYKLSKQGQYDELLVFSKVMISHAFITCLAVNNSLSPVYVIVSVILTIRREAHKLVYSCQRGIPKIVYTTQSWNSILKVITCLGIIMNSLGMTFNSEYLDKIILENESANNKTFFSYLNFTLSVFRMQDMYGEKVDPNATCYYRDRRFPYDHPTLQYKHNTEYHIVRMYKLGTIVAYELIIYISLYVFNKKILSIFYN